MYLSRPISGIGVDRDSHFPKLFFPLSRSMSAVRVVPVVDGIGECVDVTVNGSEIFLASPDGQIDRFLVSSQGGAIPTVDHVVSVQVGRAIRKVGAWEHGLFALTADETLLHFEKSPALGVSQTVLKGVTGFALGPGGAVAVSCKRKLVILKFSEKKFLSDGHPPILVPADILVLVWTTGAWIVAATTNTYFAVSPSGDRQMHDLFPLDIAPSITVLPQTSELMIVGQEGLGIFLNVHSSPFDPPSPAPRNTLRLAPSMATSVLSNYLVSLSADGIAEVFSLSSSKLVQSITLPGSAVLGAGGCLSWAPTVSGGVLYLLIPVPFETQFARLMDSQKFDEAFELINYRHTGEEREKALADYHRQVGWHLFGGAQFALAFQHFSLSKSAEMGKILKLWKDAVGGLTADLAEQANAAMTNFLLSHRGGSTTTTVEKKSIDRLLLELLGPAELVAFLKLTSDLALEDHEVRALLANAPIALATFLERSGALESALDVLGSGLPETGSALLECMHSNFRSIPSLVAKLVNLKNIDKAKLSLLVTQAPNPLELVDLIEDKSLQKQILGGLPSEEAFLRLVSLLDEAEVEQLISKGPARASCVWERVLPQLCGFSRMLCLGKLGRHQDALLVAPEFGEQYIEATGTDEDLVLLLVSVLFEQNEAAKALHVIRTHESLLLKKSPHPSKLVQILPAELPLSAYLLELLKSINANLASQDREWTMRENLTSFQFLKTHLDWAATRQGSPAIFSEESLCAVCNLEMGKSGNLVGVLPNGSLMHTACFTGDKRVL